MGTGRLAAAPFVLVALAAAGCGATEGQGAGTGASSGIPAALVREARPIGRGPRFVPPARGPVLAPCRPRLGPRRGVHVEVFAANRVVLVAAGIGARPPLGRSAGRITTARCFGALVTLEPTGVVLVRPGVRLTVADLFRSWGQPLSSERVVSFAAPAGQRVSVYVDGRKQGGAPGAVGLTPHAEIVIEVGPRVPPHSTYTFPPGT
jgi:hypothetical protein